VSDLIRHDWLFDEVFSIYKRPLLELVIEAGIFHRRFHKGGEIQVSSLVSVKTGGCSEDCHYCPQSARYKTKVNVEPLMTKNELLQRARDAKVTGSSRLCMGAAWRRVKDNSEFERILDMVSSVSAMGLEVCCTLGMLTAEQARRLKKAGLTAYNHNLDTSEDYYRRIVSTRTYQDRLDTLQYVREANIQVCSGGIIGMGESLEDRLKLLIKLASFDPQPESVPINILIPVEGTPLEQQKREPVWSMIRMVATARMLMPKSMVRLSAGRHEMSWQEQALCFLAGANSVFSGDKLLTTPSVSIEDDARMFTTLGLVPKSITNPLVSST